MEFAVDGFLVARRYALDRKIGSGGMGSVWLAHDQSLDRVCALKIVDPDKARSDEVRKRFLREARATAQIRSVHVVEVFEHGIWDGLPFIVMELLEGEDLGTRLERVGALAPEAAHRIIAQIARGLVRAHALGIVHRDLKPENVFLVPSDGDEIVKILDFGIAHHAVYSPRDKATQAGAVMGTPCYMSPEQALGETTDWRADLWAVGVLVFQCLTGKLPFFHDALGGLLTQILHEPIPSIREANPRLPKGVEDWWQRAAERDPKRRFQSASELSDALARALEIREPLSVPALVPCSEALTVDASEFEDAPSTPPRAFEFAERLASDAPVAMNTGELITQFRRKVRRRSAWAWGLVGVFSVLLATGVLFRNRLAPPRAVARLDPPGLVAALPPGLFLRVEQPSVELKLPTLPTPETSEHVTWAPPARTPRPWPADPDPVVHEAPLAEPSPPALGPLLLPPTTRPRVESYSRPQTRVRQRPVPKPSRDYGI